LLHSLGSARGYHEDSYLKQNAKKFSSDFGDKHFSLIRRILSSGFFRNVEDQCDAQFTEAATCRMQNRQFRLKLSTNWMLKSGAPYTSFMNSFCNIYETVAALCLDFTKTSYSLHPTVVAALAALRAPPRPPPPARPLVVPPPGPFPPAGGALLVPPAGNGPIPPPARERGVGNVDGPGAPPARPLEPTAEEVALFIANAPIVIMPDYVPANNIDMVFGNGRIPPPIVNVVQPHPLANVDPALVAVDVVAINQPAVKPVAEPVTAPRPVVATVVASKSTTTWSPKVNVVPVGAVFMPKVTTQVTNPTVKPLLAPPVQTEVRPPSPLLSEAVLDSVVVEDESHPVVEKKVVVPFEPKRPAWQEYDLEFLPLGDDVANTEVMNAARISRVRLIALKDSPVLLQHIDHTQHARKVLVSLDKLPVGTVVNCDASSFSDNSHVLDSLCMLLHVIVAGPVASLLARRDVAIRMCDTGINLLRDFGKTLAPFHEKRLSTSTERFLCGPLNPSAEIYLAYVAGYPYVTRWIQGAKWEHATRNFCRFIYLNDDYSPLATPEFHLVFGNRCVGKTKHIARRLASNYLIFDSDSVGDGSKLARGNRLQPCLHVAFSFFKQGHSVVVYTNEIPAAKPEVPLTSVVLLDRDDWMTPPPANNIALVNRWKTVGDPAKFAAVVSAMFPDRIRETRI
jgi:hypothetical protein